MPVTEGQERLKCPRHGLRWRACSPNFSARQSELSAVSVPVRENSANLQESLAKREHSARAVVVTVAAVLVVIVPVAATGC